jgi:hypothetical protein
MSKIYMRFDSPDYVSNGVKKDIIEIRFNALNYVMSSSLPR